MPPPRRTSFRRRQKPPFERFKDHFRKFTAFMFSNVGIILLVIFYTIGGAFIFQAIELDHEKRLREIKPRVNYTSRCLEEIWSVTAENISFYHTLAYRRQVNEILLEFQRAIVKEELEGVDAERQWSFSGAFLFSLTVITTIGYGNISPKSDWGKLMTILYAIIGMPLFLLYLSNIGDVLAKSFKWIYSKLCLCRICPGVARRRIIRERRKMRRLAKMSRALQAMEDGDGGGSSEYGTSQSSVSPSVSEPSEETDYSSTLTTTSAAIEETYEEGDESDIDREMTGSTDEITVPLTVCIMIMISYILSGAILFGRWEQWDTLDGSYFCFISLSSIGFGDLVPGDRVITADKDKVEVSFILCAVYLLLGMALIAMCFNLMQEQVIHNMRAVKRAFKACFRCR